MTFIRMTFIWIKLIKLPICRMPFSIHNNMKWKYKKRTVLDAAIWCVSFCWMSWRHANAYKAKSLNGNPPKKSRPWVFVQTSHSCLDQCYRTFFSFNLHTGDAIYKLFYVDAKIIVKVLLLGPMLPNKKHSNLLLY